MDDANPTSDENFTKADLDALLPDTIASTFFQFDGGHTITLVGRGSGLAPFGRGSKRFSSEHGDRLSAAAQARDWLIKQGLVKAA
jgi:hypothetical protein